MDREAELYSRRDTATAHSQRGQQCEPGCSQPHSRASEDALYPSPPALSSMSRRLAIVAFTYLLIGTRCDSVPIGLGPLEVILPLRVVGDEATGTDRIGEMPQRK